VTGSNATGSPRTVAINVHGIRRAVHRMTGEIRILHSVHAADIGLLTTRCNVRGQIDSAIAMGFGWAHASVLDGDVVAEFQRAA
jgi:putative selenate reductase molybdopterin-binding subunit